jgi:hypothetical protein
MSFLRPAIRACAVAALKDKTWAEDRVFDSDQTALAEALQGTVAKPYIVVYTDSDDRPVVVSNEIYDGGRRNLNLVLEIGVANAITGTNGNLVINFAATDQGMELAVDMIETQCTSALWGDPNSQWGEILKNMTVDIVRVPSRRGGQASQGIRFAARRIAYVLTTIYDIPPGVVPEDNHPLMRFIALAQGNPIFGVTDVGNILQSMLATTPAPDWQQAQAYLGMSAEVAEAAMLPGVPLPYPNVEVPPLDYSDTNLSPPPPSPDNSLDFADDEVAMQQLYDAVGSWVDDPWADYRE